MKHARTLAAAVAATATMLAPAIAHADPGIAITVDGAPATGSIGLGQAVTMAATACVNPTPGSPTYVGEFFNNTGGDPLTDPSTQLLETTTDASGDFTWNVTIPLDDTQAVYNARFYCSTAPVTSINDAAMLWVSPVITTTITASGGAAMTRSATLRVHQRAGVTTTKASPGVTVHTDPDALPGVDKVNINGAHAANLKRLIDYLAGPSAAAIKGHAGNVKYIKSALLLGSNDNNSTLNKYVAELDSGQTRVKVIEDIALTSHSAAFWNR